MGEFPAHARQDTIRHARQCAAALDIRELETAPPFDDSKRGSDQGAGQLFANGIVDSLIFKRSKNGAF